jgi:hypothetical protein
MPATLSGVLKVRLVPLVKPASESGWEMIYWLGPAGDYSIPFRQVLEEITTIIARAKPAALELPPYEDREDFVEGELQFGNDCQSVL